ncbi:ABC transporter permease [Paraflavitalea pollutisoli]|uniref:ABC transporter permease n=1 Tax=Paraflavitalea pollutisoli TaxID=3034143 RepID=UPI0023EBD2B6|nr:ABC transporter permease [Paraflavitalea sp. H1-2-19X]
MLKNYFKIAFRNLIKHKLFTGLNVFGLATGMACSILIFLWVQDERSYDQHHPQAGSLYRLTARISGIDAAVTQVPLAAALRKDLPVVKVVTRLAALQTIVTVNNQKFEENRIFYADSNLLQLFSLPLVQGTAGQQLTRPDGTLITEQTAIRYFGNAGNAMGKSIQLGNTGTDLIVTGVLQNLPSNTHLQFDILAPIKLYDATQNPQYSWGNYDVYSYLLLDPRFEPNAASIATLEKQIKDVVSKNDNTHTESSIFLQPVTDIHLRPGLLLDIDGTGNLQHVTIFTLVAVFILLIACINFMNLSTALSGQRSKEVGLRKTVGALRWQLIIQFLCESILVSFVALVIGVAIASLLLPLFNALAGKNISLHLINFTLLGKLMGIALIVGLIAGSYPAFFLSSFQAVKVLKGVKVLHGTKNLFRNGLVVVQFSISVILMVSTLVVYKQLQFIRERDMGFNKENLLYVPIPQAGDVGQHTMAMKAAFGNQASLGDYTLLSHLPTYLTTGSTDVEWPGKDPKQQIIFPQLWTDAHFLRTFGVKLLAGRYFSKDLQTDENNYVINETCLRTMNMTAAQAVGTRITMNAITGQIIGVVKDFNFKPIQQAIEPLILKYGVRPNYFINAHYFVFKTTPANLQNNLTILKKAYQQSLGDLPFSFGFIDQDLAKLYLTEQRMAKLFNVFSILSIVVSCLGLFGLATFATQKRIREIGVRKVLGASEASIVAMLSKDFVRLVGWSIVVAFPVAYWTMNAWLLNFNYRISLHWSFFALAGMIALLIAFITVSYQSVRAALTNPSTSLRRE